jgi:hypothetical protein
MEDIKYEHPVLPKVEHKMPETTLIELQAWVEPEQVVGIMAMFDADADGSISAQEAKANDAHESLFQVLTKLGVNPDDLAIALGIEPKAVREKKQKEDRDERDRMRKDWEAGQAFDKAERERIRKEPAPTPADPAAGWSATWEKKSATTLELVITNASGVKAIAYRETSSGGKPLTTGSRTVGTTAPAIDTYSYSKGWPFATLNVTLRIGHPVTGALIPVTRKGQ